MSESTIILILAAICLGGYMVAYIMSWNSAHERNRYYYRPHYGHYYPPPPPPPGYYDEREPSGISGWPIILLLFVVAVLFLVSRFNESDRDDAANTQPPVPSHQADLWGQEGGHDNQTENLITEVVEPPRDPIPQEYEPVEESLSATPPPIWKWGVQLAAKESMRWLDFLEQVRPLCGEKPILHREALSEQDAMLHYFFVGGFESKAGAERLARVVKRYAPGAFALDLSKLTGLEVFSTSK